jgi:hypothetical protein
MNLLLPAGWQAHFKVAGSYSTYHSTVHMEQAAAIGWESQIQDLESYSSHTEQLYLWSLLLRMTGTEVKNNCTEENLK